MNLEHDKQPPCIITTLSGRRTYEIENDLIVLEVIKESASFSIHPMGTHTILKLYKNHMFLAKKIVEENIKAERIEYELFLLWSKHIPYMLLPGEVNDKTKDYVKKIFIIPDVKIPKYPYL